MIGHLYRYPHPTEPGLFLYVGQGCKRDSEHRGGRSSFGRRFYKTFPGRELPTPIRLSVEVENQLELNELETVWMFQFHTWRGYEGGMNLTLPGSKDYINLGKLSGEIAKSTGQIHKLGRVQGRKNVVTGLLRKINLLPQSKAAQSRVGKLVGPVSVKHLKPFMGSIKNSEYLKPFHSSRAHQQAAGKLGGAAAVKSGHISRMNALPQTTAAKRETGRKAAASGQLEAARNSPQAVATRIRNGRSSKTVAILRANALFGAHCHWHVRRSIKKINCKFCEAD